MLQQINEDKVFVCFNIHGKELPLPEEINEFLSCNGTGFNTGDIFYTRNGQEKHTRAYSAWLFDTTQFVASENIIDHLTFILTLFEPKMEILRKFLDAPDILVFIRVWVESVEGIARVAIPSPLLIRLANICNEIYIVAIAGNERPIANRWDQD